MLHLQNGSYSSYVTMLMRCKMLHYNFVTNVCPQMTLQVVFPFLLSFWWPHKKRSNFWIFCLVQHSPQRKDVIAPGLFSHLLWIHFQTQSRPKWDCIVDIKCCRSSVIYLLFCLFILATARFSWIVFQPNMEIMGCLNSILIGYHSSQPSSFL